MDIDLLDNGCQRLLGSTPGLQEGWKLGAGAQSGDAQLHAARSGLPVPVTVTIVLRKPLDALLAIVGARLGADLQVYQTFGDKTDHLAKQVGISALFYEHAQAHHLFGHRVSSSDKAGGTTRPH